ncbi:MAG: hypothetical protein JO270_00365, partial [Acidobacteriaceae bacterium]|nr:hypothetical protein [Acidobacteriaceae bacterium]
MKILTALTIALAAAAVAQAQSADGKLPSNASSIFAELSGQLRFGFLAQKILLEVWVNKDHLIRKEGATLADGSWWGLWTGENSTGTVTAYAAVPDPINKARNHFWARFDEPAEVPMPAAILSHLLATAKQTKI